MKVGRDNAVSIFHDWTHFDRSERAEQHRARVEADTTLCARCERKALYRFWSKEKGHYGLCRVHKADGSIPYSYKRGYTDR
jgi:hypothetical protein